MVDLDRDWIRRNWTHIQAVSSPDGNDIECSADRPQGFGFGGTFMNTLRHYPGRYLELFPTQIIKTTENSWILCKCKLLDDPKSGKPIALVNGLHVRLQSGFDDEIHIGTG